MKGQYLNKNLQPESLNVFVISVGVRDAKHNLLNISDILDQAA